MHIKYIVLIVNNFTHHYFLIQVTPTVNSVVINPTPAAPSQCATQIVQNHVIPQSAIKNESPRSPPTMDFSNFSEAEIRAIKKQQRMIKNR